ncbi:MAG: Maf-like protein, partial [Firmicutes bacterium]|nr:Maf-like protein [Bacillota bacterium]
MFKLILASNSPRRKDLLNQIQIDFVVEPADIEEVLDETHTAQE